MKMSKSNPIRSNCSQLTVPPRSLDNSNPPFSKLPGSQPNLRKPDRLNQTNQSHHHFCRGKKLAGRNFQPQRTGWLPPQGPSRFASFTRKLGRLPLETNGRNGGIWKALKGGRIEEGDCLQQGGRFFFEGGEKDWLIVCINYIYIWYMSIGWYISIYIYIFFDWLQVDIIETPMLVWSMDAFMRDEWNQYKLLMLCSQAEIVVSSCYRML